MMLKIMIGQCHEYPRDPDPEFSTVDFPNPEEGASALDLSFQLANKSGSSWKVIWA